MKAVISPAKRLDFERDLPTQEATQPRFLDQAEQLNGELAGKSKQEISDLMGLSEDLTNLNYERYQRFSTPLTPENARPAVFAFDGAVYRGMDAYTLEPEAISRLQESLRILSGMYGLLRPLDLIQPYRLEMGTDLAVDGAESLYEFWGDSLTKALNEELQEGELLVNLASNQYFDALNAGKIGAEMITPKFKDFKDGKLKTIVYYTKKARGQMVRWLVEHDVQSVEGVRGFNMDGYLFSEEHTEQAGEPVFVR